MKEKVLAFIKRLKELWLGLSKKKKIWIIGGAAALVLAIVLFVVLTNVKQYAPLYSNLSTSEAGQITSTLDSKKVPYKLSAGGTTISVPSNQVDQLKVDLAAQGIPKTGEIDYSFFSQNAGFGMTDNQFNVLQRAAMQTELANLISNTQGVKSAKVMLTLPQNSGWVGSQSSNDSASASIMLNVSPGFQLTSTQINGLYHLVSKSVPNLPENNIVIMDQYYNYYDPKSNSGGNSTLSTYNQQQQIVHDIENNFQRRVTQMLTLMMGQGKVVVNVTANVDFTQSKEKQDLVEPVNQQTMEGLASSTQHITETYTGQGAGGQVGTGTNAVPTYQAGTNGNGTYQKVQDQVNYVFNKIHRDVTNSPYKITDLGIQVMIEPPSANNNNSLSQQRINDVKQILNSIVQTSISDNQGQELSANVVNQKTSITVGRLNGQMSQAAPSMNWWPYIIGGGLLLLIAGLVVWLILYRRRRAASEEEAYVEDIPQEDELKESLEDENPEQKKYNEIEKMAKQKPDQFVRLLRGWLSDER
ncbi:flagellar basal-body MS-ring/collar protein FliF [Sporolactobacillus sp. CQH2019]|uniref:flagellar basal-body MS-ring/collar protein FliF n=1 Tax=Sporolactobacillus sp. CQH2019 TaxID=3023512 RepID=UPI0023675544|nr:flagellar basal-body MS-ring/collar protein FliF [Sporolactobacillus sp. CQH2019]MDD9147067.1 flagellar basal-body MS-ring/collar protein FliF [Sporolactobacillus sp. CQH2019]